MAKLSTQRIRQDLIDTTLDGNPDYVQMIANQFEKEIVRYLMDTIGYTKESAEEALEHTRRNPESIIVQYYHLKSDEWLREQHKIWFPKTKKQAVIG